MRLALGLVRVIHPLPVFLVVATSTLLVALVSPHLPSAGFLIRCGGVVLCSQVAVGALNDFVDRRTDALYQPEKPIPAGLCSPRAALALVGLGLVGTSLLGFTFGPAALALTLVGTAAGLAYDLWLKPTPASFCAYIVGFLTLFSWILAVAGRLSPPLLLAYPGGAALLTAAYLAQSLPDIEVDAATGQRGLAAILGVHWTFRAILALCLPICLGTLALGLLREVYASVLLAAAGGFLIALADVRVHRGNLDRTERKKLFQLLAPAIAALVLAGLIALVRIS